MRVTVGISGTGGGFQKFCRGETDISDASRPISASEVEACAQDGRRVHRAARRLRRHRHRGEPQGRLGGPHHRRRAEDASGRPRRRARSSSWSQVRAGWPDREIHLFGAGVDSGTFDYFTEAIIGKAKASRGDFTSSEDDNVLVQGVASDELALGFFGLRLLRGEPRQAEARARGRRQGRQRRRARSLPQPRDHPDRHLPAAVAAGVHLRRRRRRPSGPRCSSFVEFYLAQADDPRPRGGLRGPRRPEPTTLVGDRFAKRTVGSVFAGVRHRRRHHRVSCSARNARSSAAMKTRTLASTRSGA